MAIVRRLAGLGIILLSALGVLLCMAVIAGVWVGKSRLDRAVAAVFGTIDESLGVVGTKCDRARQALEMSQHRTSNLKRIADRLKSADEVAVKEFDPMIQSVDDILDDLKSAESWLDASRTITLAVSRMSESLVSTEFAAAHRDASGMALAGEVHEFCDSAVDAIARLQMIRRELIEIRESGKLAHDVFIGLVTRIADLDGKVTNLSERIGRLDERVTELKASCTAIEERVHWWMKIAAVAITIVSLWFGISQSIVASYGQRLV